MKHNLRMAFLSLLLVLTLGVMPVFAESADHAMDWTHGIGSRYRTDVTSALPFEDELFFISGSQLLRVDDPEYEPEVVCNLEDIIWSEALKQSGYYGQVMLLNGGAELVLFSANEGRLYSFVPPTDDTMVRMQMVTELDYSTVPQMGWKKFPIAKDLYDVTVEQAVYDAENGLYVIAKDKTDEYQIVWFDLDTGKGEMLEFALEDDENSHLLTDMPGIFQWSGTSSKYERTLYDGKVLTTVDLSSGEATKAVHNWVNTLTLQPIPDYDVTLGDYVTHDAYYAYAPNKDNTAMYFVHDNTVWVMEYDEENSQFSEPRGIDKLPFFAEDTMCGFYWCGFYLIQTHDGLYLCHTGDETARAYLYGGVE